MPKRNECANCRRGSIRPNFKLDVINGASDVDGWFGWLLLLLCAFGGYTVYVFICGSVGVVFVCGKRPLTRRSSLSHYAMLRSYRVSTYIVYTFLVLYSYSLVMVIVVEHRFLCAGINYTVRPTL